jgi:hypothetical protein
MPRQMINGALEIIRGVSSAHIDPLVLPESHGDGSLGYIVIAYVDGPDTFDMLFLKGKAITQCARISRDIRTTQSVESVRGRLRASGGRALVYLFQTTEPALDRFERTLHYEPCLKLQIDHLTRRQRGMLVRSSGCRRGLLELDQFPGVLPSIELYDFESTEQLMVLESRMKRGRLILYDVERNRDLFKGEPARPEREPPRPPALPSPSEPPPPVRPGPEPPVQALNENAPHGPPDEFVLLFDRMFRTFRREAFECCGKKLEPLIQGAEHEVRLLNPAFDLNSLSRETAPAVLNLMEAMVREAPFMKRSKLKALVLTLLGDLYSRHYDTLERNGAVETVEQSYFRLRA